MTSIGSAYPTTVNAYSCRNCGDVARAQMNVDPADPLGSARPERRFDRAFAEDPQIAALNAFAIQHAAVPAYQRAYGSVDVNAGAILDLSA